MNALVISGGGSKGAFAGGVAEYLISQCKKDYKLFIGTSTGSLLIPFLAIGDIERIKEIYTTIRQEDIYSVSPFYVKKKNGIYITKMNYLGMIKQYFNKQKTFGDSHNLKKLIKKNFTAEDFERLKNSGKEVIVTVANFTTMKIEHKSSNDYEHKDFCDWMWASANLVPLMSILTKNGHEYGDGGFGNVIPIQKAIDNGATTVDAIVLRLENRVFHNPPLHSPFNVLLRIYAFMLNQIAYDDLTIARLEAAYYDASINFYYINDILTDQSYIFDNEEMTKWWQDGYELYQNKVPQKHNLRITK